MSPRRLAQLVLVFFSLTSVADAAQQPVSGKAIVVPAKGTFAAAGRCDVASPEHGVAVGTVANVPRIAQDSFVEVLPAGEGTSAYLRDLSNAYALRGAAHATQAVGVDGLRTAMREAALIPSAMKQMKIARIPKDGLFRPSSIYIPLLEIYF